MSGSSNLWYEQTKNVDHLFNGVFEGGGAKGIAYAGALLALKDRGCWFASVAGTSAGSITAALVAAGFEPNEIQEMAPMALRAVTPSRTLKQRILITKMGYGFYSKESLEKWLRDTLSKRLEDLGASSCDPNFKELFDATNIELNVVATSLSLKSPVVFSHHETPRCSVAAAVAASAAIPFAFSDSRLEVNDGGEIWHQTIVDGGVWVNFPWFIYTDRQFRKLYERCPEDLSDSPIIGFILDEKQSFDSNNKDSERTASELIKGSDIKFSKDVRVRPWEKRPIQSSQENTTAQNQLGILFRLVAVLGTLFNPARIFGDSQAKQISPDRWPEPSTQFRKHLVNNISGLFEGLSGLIGVLAVAFVIVSTFFMFGSVTAWLFPWWWSTAVLLQLLTAVLWAMILLAILLVAESIVLVFVAAFFLNQPLRRVGYGLATTFFNTSGAPEWTATDHRIIRLPVGGVATTDFDMDPEVQEALIEQAMKETGDGLTKLGIPTQDDRKQTDS